METRGLPKAFHRPAVIITGSSSGIGAATACRLADLGTDLTLVARSKQRLSRTARHIHRKGGSPLLLDEDVSAPGSCQRIVAATISGFGRIDAIISSAATEQPLSPISDVPPDQWLNSLRVNLVAPFLLFHFAFEELKKRRGRVIHVSSGAAEIPIPTASPYCASKASLDHLTRVLAAEAPDVVCIAFRPGVVDTPMQARLRQNAPKVMPREYGEYYDRIKSENRLLPPEIPARSLAWLAWHATSDWSGRIVEWDDPEILKSIGTPATPLTGSRRTGENP